MMDGMLHLTADAAQSATVQDDWDFVNSQPHPLGGLHPYPARFIPAIPKKLIAAFPPRKGLSVLDPFCGSGTTLTEAQVAGLPSVGVDLNPIAVLMSRVTTGPIPRGLAKALSEVVERAEADNAPLVPEIPRLDHWFRADIQVALAALAGAIATAPIPTRDLLRLALSAIIVRVSNQESDTRYAAIQKPVARNDVFQQFARSALKIFEALRARPASRPQTKVIEANILTLPAAAIGQQVGLVVTSPPYPNAYEYWLYHKYRMWWLGFDPLAVKADEIGARAHFFSGKRHTAENFRQQMRELMQLLDQVLVKGGHACFVVGRSKIHGEVVDNAKILNEVASDSSFQEVFKTERVIAATKKSFNLSHANIKTETVLVLKRSK